MDNNDGFHTFGLKYPDNPLKHLKKVYQKLLSDGSSQQEQEQLEGFIEFAEKDMSKGEMNYLNLSNNGETQKVSLIVLMALGGGSKKLALELVPELHQKLYKNQTIPVEKVHFIYTQVTGIWEWWEDGEVRQESFGTVYDDKLIGFVRLGM